MRLSIVLIFAFLFASCSTKKEEFHTQQDKVTIKINDKVVTEAWNLSPKLKPDTFIAPLRNETNTVTFLDKYDSISFAIKVNDTIDFKIIQNKKDTAFTRIIGSLPNVTFSDDYIAANKGKVRVEIPEVSELANIILALHKDAEKDKNMFDSDTEYYKKVRQYFEPYRDHPIIDTLHKYVKDLKYNEKVKHPMFSNESYWYYFTLKMNACSYIFDENDTIVNNGVIREIAKGWHSLNPMKDVDLMTDFAKKSNFRQFYKQNKAYYDDLLETYSELNPITKMQTWLEDKFGFAYGNYSIYFSPLVAGAHSTQGFTDNGFSQTLMFIKRSEYNDKYSETMNRIIKGRVVFTEIDHNYVNRVSDKYLNRINEVFKDREFWADGNDIYESPYKVFNEYMTWAFYSLYMADHYDKKDLYEYLPKMENQMENRRGFKEFKLFNRELIRKYEENKKISMNDLYLHMLDWSEKFQSS